MSPDEVHLNYIDSKIFLSCLQDVIEQALGLLVGIRSPMDGIVLLVKKEISSLPAMCFFVHVSNTVI